MRGREYLQPWHRNVARAMGTKRGTSFLSSTMAEKSNSAYIRHKERQIAQNIKSIVKISIT